MHKKAIIVDTNVLIHDPSAINILMNDVNILYIHSAVIMELDALKNKIDIGRDCREAIRILEKLHFDSNPRLKIINNSDFSHQDLSHLNKTVNDHKIIALAHNLLNNTNKKFKEIKIVSKDITVRILARDVGIQAEDYISTNTLTKIPKGPKKFNVPFSKIQDDFTFKMDNSCIQNEGIICISDWDGNIETPYANTEWRENFTAIKKGDKFHVIPNNINIMGITPYSMDGTVNWEQYIAMYQLLDSDIKLCFMMGGSGSGKTMLSLAASIQLRKNFRNILVTRPMIHLEDDDRMGFLPGNIDDKMSPWIKPIWRALSFISSFNDKNKNIITRVKDLGKISVEPLDYIRGLTYIKDILIVDEAQNLTPHQIKTIITRCGEGSKIIFTGDLGQIDRKGLDINSSGLAYAGHSMKDNEMVGISYFGKTVRSELADLAEKLL